MLTRRNTDVVSRRAEIRRRATIPGHAIFYPAAAAYAVFVVPASVHAMLGSTVVLPGLASPAGHAYEMLFGFALAVVAGNQLGPMSVFRLAPLVALWAIARIAFLLDPQSITTVAINIGFAALLALYVAPRLLRAAKKIRNQALPLVLVAICASSVAYQIGSRTASVSALRSVPVIGVILFAMLMLFMGGRIIAPTVAGQLQRQGDKLQARVQPRIEAALLVTMTVAVAASVSGTQPISIAIVAAALIIAGVLAALRMFRWRLWALRGRPDLLCLAAGYAWLAVGLPLYGIALIVSRYQIAALHVITVGSLGTLTLNVMALTWTLKARADPSRARLTVWATALIAAATVFRAVAGAGATNPIAWLHAASVCWSTAYALLLIRLARVRS